MLRGALLLGKAAGEFVRRAEARADYQDFFGGRTRPEPIPSERDAVMTGGRCDDGKAHRKAYGPVDDTTIAIDNVGIRSVFSSTYATCQIDRHGRHTSDLGQKHSSSLAGARSRTLGCELKKNAWFSVRSALRTRMPEYVPNSAKKKW